MLSASSQPKQQKQQQPMQAGQAVMQPPQQAAQVAQAAPVAQSAPVPTQPQLYLPSFKTSEHVYKLALKTKKPIDMYFYADSIKGNISIVSDGEDRIIFKNEDEHSSPIINTYKSDNNFIVVTENTIYILSANTKIN